MYLCFLEHHLGATVINCYPPGVEQSNFIKYSKKFEEDTLLNSCSSVGVLLPIT